MLGGGEDSSLGPFARLRPGITGEAQKRWRAHYGQSLSQAPPLSSYLYDLEAQKEGGLFRLF